MKNDLEKDINLAAGFKASVLGMLAPPLAVHFLIEHYFTKKYPEELVSD